MGWQVGALVVGVVGTVVPTRRVPAWAVVATVAVVALAIGVVPVDVVADAVGSLSPALLFLLVAVPLAVLLDELGFFAAVAAGVAGGRHLRVGLWALAAGVTVVFNLDAAVVLLTPLYVRLAHRHGDDPVVLAFIPALLASLASTALPVSNLTNLVLADRLALEPSDFLLQAAPAVVAAAVVGWIAFRRLAGPSPPGEGRDTVDRTALRWGLPVVAWLLAGFIVGGRLGVPAWAVAATALLGLAIAARRPPWRHVPVGPAVLALSLGVLALAAAPALDVDRVLAVGGIPGELGAMAAAVVAANVVNNLPAVLVALPALDVHPERAWAVLLGANVGPTLWVTGALSTLLWQATMRRLGHPVGVRAYVAVGVRVGLPALAAVAAVRVIAVAF